MKPSHPVRTVKTETLSKELYIDFDLYTEGDPDFKKELALLLVSNLSELRLELYRAIAENSQDVFLCATHKAKVALSMLDDPDLTSVVRTIEKELGNPLKTQDSIGALAGTYENITDAISESLRAVAAA